MSRFTADGGRAAGGVLADQPRWLRGRRLRDARGVVIAVQGAGRRMLDGRTRRAGAPTVLAMRRGDPAWRRVAIRDGSRHVAVVAVGTCIILWRGVLGGHPLWVIVASWVLLMGLMGVSHLVFLTPELGRQLIVFRIVAGECPACCYSLVGLEPEGDGCVVCPECGGAWRAGVEQRELGE